MTKRQTTVTTILTLVALALAVLVSRQIWFRVDITKERTNTISPVSRGLYAEIDDTVQITYFISDRLRAIHPMPGEIEDFLREYVGFSRGKIRLAVRDPIKADMVAEAEDLGILPQQIPIVEQGETTVLTVYSGISIEHLDEVSVLPVVFSLETLEYDLTSRIRALVRGTPRVAGIVVGDAAVNPGIWDESYGELHSALAQAGFTVRFVNPEEEIPASISALVVLDGVETLDENALYMIDRYVGGGGRVLFTVKAVGVDVRGGLEARRLRDRGLLAMLETYGVTVQPEIVMDTTALTMQYQTQAPGGSTQIRIARNFQWIRVLPENANPAHPVSARFGGLDLYWANPLTLSPPEGIEAMPLFLTTEDAWTMREPFFASPEFLSMMERDADETAIGNRILGAGLSGIFPSAFESHPLPEVEAGLPPVEPGTARIVVVGDSDFATSFINVTGAQHNMDFIVQALDWLGSDDDIIGIRARTAGSGRLDRISDPDARAAAMAFAGAVNMFVMPILVILAGVFISQRRKALANPKGPADITDGGEKERRDGV